MKKPGPPADQTYTAPHTRKAAIKMAANLNGRVLDMGSVVEHNAELTCEWRASAASQVERAVRAHLSREPGKKREINKVFLRIIFLYKDCNFLTFYVARRVKPQIVTFEYVQL